MVTTPPARSLDGLLGILAGAVVGHVAFTERPPMSAAPLCVALLIVAVLDVVRRRLP